MNFNDNKNIRYMKKFFKYLLFIVLGIVFLSTFVFLWKKSNPAEAEYNEVTAKVMSLSRSTVLTGSIVPRDEVQIKPQISGIIAVLYKEAGETVKENEVIAKVKVIADMSQLSSAESRVRLAQINLEQAQTNYDRVKALYDQDLVSADEYDKALQSLDQAKEEKSAAQESLEVVRDGVSSSNASGSSTLIRSTISGLILDIPVKVGNSVINSNTFNDGTTIATVANMNDLIFDGKVDETEVGSLKTGMPMYITIGALQNLKFEANLEYIAPKATANNNTNQFEVKAAVKVPEGTTVRSGYSANAEVVLQHADSVVTVPESVLSFENDSSFVYVCPEGVVADKKGQVQYEKRHVETGMSDGVNIEVKKGLKEGDIVRGAKKII